MRYVYLAIFVLALLPQPIVAQTVCPGGPSSATVSSQVPLKVIWCSLQSENVTGANVYGLPTTKVPANAIVALGGPYGDGKIQYQGTIPAQPRGNYSVTLRTTNLGIAGDPTTLQEGPASSPFALGVIDPSAAPLAPANVYFSK